MMCAVTAARKTILRTIILKIIKTIKTIRAITIRAITLKALTLKTLTLNTEILKIIIRIMPAGIFSAGGITLSRAAANGISVKK